MPTFEAEDLFRTAKSLITDRAFLEVLRRLESRYSDDWKRSDPDRSIYREHAYHMVRAIDELRGELEALASEPDVAAYNRRLRGV
jgi:hypothetical protein